MDSFKIRYATANDSDSLANLARETFWDAYHTESKLEREHLPKYIESAFSLEQIRSELEQESTNFLIVERNIRRYGAKIKGKFG